MTTSITITQLSSQWCQKPDERLEADVTCRIKRLILQKNVNRLPYTQESLRTKLTNTTHLAYGCQKITAILCVHFAVLNINFQ